MTNFRQFGNNDNCGALGQVDVSPSRWGRPLRLDDKRARRLERGGVEEKEVGRLRGLNEGSLIFVKTEDDILDV